MRISSDKKVLQINQRCKLFNIISFNVARIKCACDSHNLWPVRAVFKAVCVLQLIKCFKLLAFTASKPEFSSWSTFSYNLWRTVFDYSSQVQHGLQACLYCTCLCTSSRTRLYFGLLGFARACDSILITAEQTVFVCPTLSNWYSCSLSQLRTDCWDFAQKSQNPGLFLPW